MTMGYHEGSSCRPDWATAAVDPFRSIADRVASAFKLRKIHERIRERVRSSNPLCSAILSAAKPAP